MKKTPQSDKKKNLKRSHLLELGAAVLIIVFVNLIGHYLFGRLDLTAEKRYTISKSTKRLLKGLEEPVTFRVYLEGDLTGDYQRLQNETREMLNQFRAYSKYVNYEFVNPNETKDNEERQQFFQKLAKKGIQPSYLQVKTTNGVEQQVIFPAADVSYKGHETSIQLVQNLSNFLSTDMALNNSVQNLEYVLSNAIRGLARVVKPRIGFTYGHGELDNRDLYDMLMALYDNYTLENVNLTEDINALTGRTRGADSTIHLANKYDVLVVAKPRQPFSDQELYILDQYIMYGGKVLWLIDPLDADLDSLQSQEQAVATRFPLNLDEMLFNYGVRVNADLVEDVRCRPIPITVGMAGDRPQIALKPWFYFPDLVPSSKHPIARNLDLVKTDFVSSIDLVDNTSSQGVDKTVLLATSEYSRVRNAPVVIDLNEARVDIDQLDQRLFNKRNLPVAVLLEGTFQSMWRNRLAPEFTQLPEMGYRDTSARTKMIVVGDGDLIKNRINYKEGYPYPLGFDLYTNTMYANKQFLLNAVDYLAGDEEGLLTRSRDITMRKLNAMAASKDRARYQALNVALPAALVLMLVPAVLFIRKKRYIKKK